MDILKTEPVAVVAAVEAILAVAIGYGLNMSAEQLALILGAVTAVLAVLVRGRVSPTE